MKRPIFGLTALALIGLAPALPAQSPEDASRTSAYVAGFQNKDGGFAAEPGKKSSLGATSSAVRILKHTGGTVPDVNKCMEFVKSCADRGSGGFAPEPGGKPEVHATAVGLMAYVALGIPSEEAAKAAVDYFAEHAKTFEEIRIAAAGLEAVKSTAPAFPEWARKVEADRNPDGTWGRGAGQARDTGGAAAALLRMGVKLEKSDAVVAALRLGQRPDGGWGKGAGNSDLESTYRVMRALHMLKERPQRLDRLEAYVAGLRRSDGGYGVKSGEPSSLSGTYFATTVLDWADQFHEKPGQAKAPTAADGPRSLFNGKDLAGWEGDKELWSARDGMIVGKSPGLKHNVFLATEKSYGDFVLRLSFRIKGDAKANSGVQFRSVRIPGHEMSGYQADIGEGYWGCLYDESRRNKVLEKPKEVVRNPDPDGWNDYEIRAQGNHIVLKLNGAVTVDYHEADPKIARDGKIALQLHAGGPLEVDFKDLVLEPLPAAPEGETRSEKPR